MHKIARVTNRGAESENEVYVVFIAWYHYMIQTDYLYFVLSRHTHSNFCIVF